MNIYLLTTRCVQGFCHIRYVSGDILAFNTKEEAETVRRNYLAKMPCEFLTRQMVSPDNYPSTFVTLHYREHTATIESKPVVRPLEQNGLEVSHYQTYE